MPRKKRTKKESGMVMVSKAALARVVTLGAGHHAAVATLKRTIRKAPAKRKPAKKGRRRR